MRKKILLVLAILPIAMSFQGCGSETPQASPDAVKNFKGGPMPEEFKKQFEAQRKASADAAAASAAKGQQGH